jgi:hypothetical protein
MSYNAVTGSSSFSSPSFDPVQATDGDPTTIWASATAPPQWIEIDVTGAPVVSQGYALLAHATEESSAPSAWTYEGSNDGSTWTVLDTRSGISLSGGFLQPFLFSNSTAYRYYRLNISATPGGGGGIVRLSEFHIGYTGVPFDRHLTGIVCSSFYASSPTFAPINILDGNTSTEWTSDASGPPAWVAYIPNLDLQPFVAVSYSMTASPTEVDGAPSAWELQGAVDEWSTWTTIDTRSGEAFVGSTPNVYTVTGAAPYNIYRLYVTAIASGGTGPSGTYVRLSELSIAAGVTDYALAPTDAVRSRSAVTAAFSTATDYALSLFHAVSRSTVTATLSSSGDFAVGGTANSHSSVSAILTISLESIALALDHAVARSYVYFTDSLISTITIQAVSFLATTRATINGLAKQLPVGATVADSPIQMSVRCEGTLELLPPPLVIDDVEALQHRVVPGVTVSLPVPAIVTGRPTMPMYWAQMQSSTTAHEGPGHIHAIPDPDPVWNPATSGWYYPPPSSGAGDARWTVNDLPDPSAYNQGYYWLGEPSSQDGTIGINPAARQWAPNGSTPSAPSWRSIYPYKPSVRQHVYYGPGGNMVTIDKGVRFNLHFIEHMWMDWGRAMPQPFTWVMVGIIMDYPTPGYSHTLLDSGRDPRAVGYPALNEYNVPYDSVIRDNLNYRNLLATDPRVMWQASELNPTAGHRVGTPFNSVAKPRMFFGIFNGDSSWVGNYSPDGNHITKGRLATGKEHRFYTMGRQYGHIGINYASHLVVFEMRFWHHALTEANLAEQYGQLASTWKFTQYN